jgi:site-specific recombinase
MRPLLRLVFAWILVGLYAGSIFVLSSLSQLPLGSTRDPPHLDKLYHALEYGGLTFVLIHALCLTFATRPSMSLQRFSLGCTVHMHGKRVPAKEN